MERLAKKLISWASILEQGTREQAQRAASMPFIWPHLALMPDAHQGKGAAVGSVIPTLGAIMPAAVGVDIGCFHGDTRVPLLNGRQKTLREMAETGGTWWVYSLNRDGLIVPGNAVALKTRTDAELMRVTVSGGDEIICTPDHRFMMNDGTYCEARNLRFNDSLMPLYRRSQTRQLQMAEVGARNITTYMAENPEHFRDAVAGNGQRGAPVLAQFNVSPRACDECEHVAGNPAALRWHKSREHGHNHKVIAVEHLSERADVYCLQVEEHHNFALAAGVFVHNCGMIAVRTQFTAEDMRGRNLAALREAIERAVPLSAGNYNSDFYDDETKRRVGELFLRDGSESAGGISPDWSMQLGTLGSGNHFIEVSLDEQDRVWLFLHSGSRGVGNRLAMKHIKIALNLCKQWWISLPDPDLAYLVEGTDEFWNYIRDLRWAQHFALLNREEMMHRVVGCLADWSDEPVEQLEAVNCFAGETEVMTRVGSRPIEALTDGAHELLTADGAWVKAPVRSFGRQEVSDVTLSRSGVIKHVRATAGHKWLLRTRRGLGYEATTDQLRAGDRLQFSFPPRLQMAPDRLSVARGFVYGDGYRCSPGRSAANFHGAKDAALLPYFKDLGRPPRRYSYDRHGCSGTYTRITGLPAEWKTDVPSLDSEPSELYGWLAGYFAADGDVGKTGRPTLSSASYANLEYVRLLCQEIGIGTFGIRTRVRSGWGNAPSPVHLLGLMRTDLDSDFFLIDVHRARFEAARDNRRGNAFGDRRGWNVVSVRPTGETTEVYCAVVEGTHSFALADNILVRNCHHNYTEQMSGELLSRWQRGETGHRGHVWLSRKGAIDASEGKPGLIPGSMGTRSYVVTGKGNTLSLNSSPHGAGREYSRSAARKTFTRAQLDEAMNGIEWRHTDAFLDEIPGAYKPVEQVMADAADLVEIRHTLRQIVNVKGD